VAGLIAISYLRQECIELYLHFPLCFHSTVLKLGQEHCNSDVKDDDTIWYSF